MNDKTPIRIGIVGTNFVSDWLADAAATLDYVNVTAVYSRAQQTGDTFAQKHSIPHVFTDYDAFLASDEIDAVYIASPNFAHAEQAIRALNADKHVLCEKVIATNSRELSEMIAAAKANRRVLLEAMRPSFDPCIALVREQLPKLGKLRRVVLDFNQYSSRYDKFKAGDIQNAFNPAYSNAAIMDIGVYIVHIAAKLFGRPRRILSMSTLLHNGFEGSGHVLLDYGDMKAELSYSKITESVTPFSVQAVNARLNAVLLPSLHSLYTEASAENWQFVIVSAVAFVAAVSPKRAKEPSLRVNFAYTIFDTFKSSIKVSAGALCS